MKQPIVELKQKQATHVQNNLRSDKPSMKLPRAFFTQLVPLLELVANLFATQQLIPPPPSPAAPVHITHTHLQYIHTHTRTHIQVILTHE